MARRWTNRRYARTSAIETRKPAMPSHAGSFPAIARTSPPPASEPTRPMRIVSHAGMGSGPGTAKRASAPEKNAVTMIETTCAIAPRVSRHDRGMASSVPAAPFLRSFRLLARDADDYTDELPALQGVAEV